MAAVCDVCLRCYPTVFPISLKIFWTFSNYSPKTKQLYASFNKLIYELSKKLPPHDFIPRVILGERVLGCSCSFNSPFH